MFRLSLLIGLGFIAVAAAYFFLQGDGQYLDRAGVTMFACLGIAMAFSWGILLSSARDS